MKREDVNKLRLYEYNMHTKTQEKWILYSTCDEDSTSELRALNITPDDRVISVTGSGCRTLSLLTRNPRSLVSVDFSPGQNYLLELKLAAIRTLSYDTLLAFLGIEECSNRWIIFESLAERIPANAMAYFRRHRWAIENGILFSGRHERFYVRVVAPLVHLFFGRHLKQLFSSSTVEEQYRVYKEHIDGRLWRRFVRTGFSENTLRLLLNDANYHIKIDVPSIGDYILQRLDHTFSHHLARDNHWVSFMFNGKYSSRTSLPHFLLRDSYEAIRHATTRVTVVTDNLIHYLKTVPNQAVDKFSLSDVTSCINKEEFNTLLDEVFRTGRAGGHLCYRNFLAKYSVPRDCDVRMRREDAVSSALDRDDLAFVYSFEVATIGAAS
jgi:S-adenosylmethionine-diacylglycerol 3-amino-3-carboxypropyl transferase